MSSSPWPRVLLRRLGRPALAVCATVLALLAGEAIVRVLGWAPGIKPIELNSYDCIYKRSMNPVLGFELKADYRSDTPDFIETYERTNSHGQRDKERTLQKPEGVRRILLLGDSVVEGYGLRESETISRQLEESYVDRFTEVLNFGVSAYCTRAEIELLEVKGLRFDPDVVVLVFVENDFDNFNREAFPLEGTIDRPAFVETLFRHSHFFRLAGVRLNLFHFGAEADPLRWNQAAIGDNNVAEGLHYSLGDELHPSAEGCRVAAEALKGILADLDAGLLPSAREVPRSVSSDAEAIAAAKALGQARPNDARVHNRLGTELLKAGKPAEAVTQFKQAIEADPGHAGAHSNLGLAYERLGHEGAQTQFERAIQLRPDFFHARHNLARILMRKGRGTEAVVQLRHAIQIDPNHVGTLNMLGTALGKQHRFAEAASHLERAVQLDPNHAEAHSNLGAAYAGQGRLREAIAQFEEALRIDPGDPEALENLRRVTAALQQ